MILVSLTSLICLLAGDTEPGGCGARQEGSSKLSSVSKLASIIILSHLLLLLLYSGKASHSLSLLPPRSAFLQPREPQSEWSGEESRCMR